MQQGAERAPFSSFSLFSALARRFAKQIRKFGFLFVFCLCWASEWRSVRCVSAARRDKQSGLCTSPAKRIEANNETDYLRL